MEKILKVLAMHNVSEKNKIQGKPKAKIYGFAVDETNSDPSTSVTYIEDAVGLRPASNTFNGTNGSFSGGSWLERYPFNAIRPVTFSGGNVSTELNENNFNVNTNDEPVSTAEDVMIEIPPVYWKFTKTETGYEVRWSSEKIDDGYQALAHERGGVLKGNLYVGAYEGYFDKSLSASDRIISSLSGVTPAGGVSFTNQRNYAQRNGSGYDLVTFHTITLLQILFVTMFKTLNSQSIFKGLTNVSAVIDTGTLNTNGMYYGDNTNSGLAMKFMGIENLWGNTNMPIEGLLFDTNGEYLISDNTVFNNTGEGYPYKAVDSYTTSSRSSYISQVIGEQSGAFLPYLASGSATTYYCDYAYISAPETYMQVIRYGGEYNKTTQAGIFYYRYIGLNTTSTVVCGRIQYLAP